MRELFTRWVLSSGDGMGKTRQDVWKAVKADDVNVLADDVNVLVNISQVKDTLPLPPTLSPPYPTTHRPTNDITLIDISNFPYRATLLRKCAKVKLKKTNKERRGY